jgi:hypothetical protein
MFASSYNNGNYVSALTSGFSGSSSYHRNVFNLQSGKFNETEAGFVNLNNNMIDEVSEAKNCEIIKEIKKRHGIFTKKAFIYDSRFALKLKEEFTSAHEQRINELDKV